MSPALYRLFADLVLVAHLAFILFVVLGALLAFRWPRTLWAHLPAALWGVGIELFGWRCPLTPLEQWLRRSAGSGVYRGGFIDHYLVPIIYPPGLTRETQLVLAAVVVAVNVVAYGILIRRGRISAARARRSSR